MSEWEARLLSGDDRVLTPLCPLRLWKKMWAVPSPEQFFVPLYKGCSGDFKVSSPPCDELL